LRLLDHVAQCSAPFRVRQDSGATWQLTGASDFAQEVARCPLRYVLTDDLLRACIDLAYSEGAGLSACIDLMHFPAERVWIEWDAIVQREELARLLPACAGVERVDSLRHGMLISADATGRTGSFRTFWLAPGDPAEPMMAAVETLIDLSGDTRPSPPQALFDGAAVAVRDPHNAQIDSLLRCARFRLNPAWQRYYASVAQTAAQREEVMSRSLSTVVFDTPIVLALLLLLGMRSGIVQAPVSRERLNAKRFRLGRQPLLAHIEVSCPILASEPFRGTGDVSGALRSAPRFHHVRGHIVRREDLVFWRRSHWRGHLRLGSIQSRTVTLRLPTAAARSTSAH